MTYGRINILGVLGPVNLNKKGNILKRYYQLIEGQSEVGRREWYIYEDDTCVLGPYQSYSKARSHVLRMSPKTFIPASEPLRRNQESYE